MQDINMCTTEMQVCTCSETCTYHTWTYGNSSCIASSLLTIEKRPLTSSGDIIETGLEGCCVEPAPNSPQQFLRRQYTSWLNFCYVLLAPKECAKLFKNWRCSWTWLFSWSTLINLWYNNMRSNGKNIYRFTTSRDRFSCTMLNFSIFVTQI